MTEKERKITGIIEEVSTWEYAPINELIGNFNIDSDLLKRLILIGPTQVGKTTLITDLIGIKTEEKTKVDKLLRGGTKQGKSSTSTAIIYSRSPKEKNSPDFDKFGWAIGKLTDSMSTLVFDYYTENELTEKINNVNEENRNDLSYVDSDLTLVTYIHIPSKYFSDDAPKYLHLVDLPGFGDRSSKMQEKIKHTLESLSDFTAGVVAVVTADNINSLSNIYKEYIYSRVPESVLVAVTYSVSRSDEIKRIVAESTDPANLEAEIREHYGDKIKNAEDSCHHNPEKFKERIFPIESKNWLKDNGYDNIKNLADYQKKSILSAIEKMECKTGIDACYQNIAQRITDMGQKINELNQQNIEAEKQKTILENNLEKYNEILEKAKDELQEEENKIDYKGIELGKKLFRIGKKSADYTVESSDLYVYVGENGKNPVKVENNFIEFLTSVANEILDNTFNSYERDYSKYSPIFDETLNDNFQYYRTEIITPEKDGLILKTFGLKWSEKVLPVFEELLGECISAVAESFSYDIKKSNEKIDDIVIELKRKVRKSEEACELAQKKVKEYENKIKDNTNEINVSEKEIKILEEKKDHIVEIFIKHFNRKMRDLTARINRETDPDVMSALLITQSAIANNMKGTIRNHG